MQKKKLFLLDAYALIFRGYYAFIKNPRINSKGLDTSAILGFMNSLVDVIKRENPNHLAVAFDKGGSDMRNEIFPAYKAHRDETPEAIKIAIPYIHQLLEAMHIPIIEKSGFEADDLIGTLAKQAEKAGYQVFMVTPDKDFAQLVSENIFMYKPSRMGNGIEIWGVEEVKQKFEVNHPLQVIDYLGMMGDAVDNFPGLPGVGEKTAKKFIKEYGSLENLLANTHQLTGKLKENIEANKELGILSKKLATIITDCPIEFDETDFELSQPDFDKTSALFQELEFRQMAESFMRFFKERGIQLQNNISTENQVSTVNQVQKPTTATHQLDLFSIQQEENTPETNNSGYKNITNTTHFYQLANTPVARKLLINYLLQQKSVCFDTETTSLDTFEATLVGISFSCEKGKGYYVPFPENQAETRDILDEFRVFFESESIEKVAQNLKFDMKILMNYGIELQDPLFDTMIAHYLLNPDMRHNMDLLAETYLNYQPIPIEDLIGKKGKNQQTMRTVDINKITEYAVEDADITFQLKQFFEKELAKNNLTKLFNEIEIPLIKVLASMEFEGIRIDTDFLKELSKQLTTDIQNLEKSIYEQAGETFNLASPKQLGVVLFDNLKLIDKPKKTKTGQYATGEEILVYLVDKHPIIGNILEWRSLIKLQNTYVDALPNEVHPKTGRIHTTFSQTVAATGRLSSNNPNLQNIPIRTERGREIRKAFIPRDENYILASADYSQIELRLIADMSGDPTMVQAFKNGEDIHKSTASKVFNVPLDEVTKEQRSHAKTVNFGIIYGVSSFGLSQQTDLTRTESKELIDTYFKTYPTLKSFIDQQIEFAREKGYVETLLGRRRYLHNINSQNSVVRAGDERNSINAPIQGSAADIIKIAMINIYNYLKEHQCKSKMLLQVHDELVFDIHKDEQETLLPIIKQLMENAYQLSFPLIVDVGTGNDWLEAH
ncbi:MAG: DNA polymerase I [Flavobacteriaceae bacterium]|nr:DNA polymerase I [Flavobacteriaceae bacterium]